MLNWREIEPMQWMGYGGAESFPDGTRPQIATVAITIEQQVDPGGGTESLTAVGDAILSYQSVEMETGIGIIVYFGEGETRTWSVDGWKALLAMSKLEPIMREEDLLKLGFKRSDEGQVPPEAGVKLNAEPSMGGSLRDYQKVPTKPGWYWRRPLPYDSEIVEVWRNEDDVLMTWTNPVAQMGRREVSVEYFQGCHQQALWEGPIERPRDW